MVSRGNDSMQESEGADYCSYSLSPLLYFYVFATKNIDFGHSYRRSLIASCSNNSIIEST